MRMLTLLLFVFSTAAMAVGPSGRYATECLQHGTGSRMEAWVFTDRVGRFFHQISTYSDQACQDILETQAPAGNYRIRSLSAENFEVDLLVARPIDIPAEYSIVKLVGNELYLGLKTAQLDGSSPDRRPLELDESVLFILRP